MPSEETTPLQQDPSYGSSGFGSTTSTRNPSLRKTRNSTPDRSSNESNSTTNNNNQRTEHSSSTGASKIFKEGSDNGFSKFHMKSHARSFIRMIFKYFKFVGPSIILSVAYMDPGNYVTAVSAGALYQYKLLFIIFMSNLFAVFLQALCIKLGTVTGLDLAECCREYFPRWITLSIYAMAEFAIVATDLAEVVGMAIALDILFDIPLTAGICLTVLDVLVILFAYKPKGDMKYVRYFEYLVSFLVFMTVICFVIELWSIGPVNKGDIFKGFLPSSQLLETQGLYLSCGIVGATVMPHSLYLGSGLVQPRLRDFDKKHGYLNENSTEESSDEEEVYKPSIHAINYSLKYSVAELIISLSSVAIFVNSAILIVAGAVLSGSPDAADADLYSIYDMLRSLLSPIAGTVFALAMLFSGQSSGIVCTLAGQMVAEGFIHWTVQPWVRRLITRSLAIVPCFFVAMFVGRKGLAQILTGSQVVLSLLLPFVSAPLIYFTAQKSIMSVPITPRLFKSPDGSFSTHKPTQSTSDESGATDASAADATAQTPLLAETRDEELQADSEPYDDIIIATTRRIEEENPETSSLEHHGTRVTPIAEDSESVAETLRYEDKSNSTLTNITAVVVLALISGLNFFLIISAAMGADVHF